MMNKWIFWTIIFSLTVLSVQGQPVGKPTVSKEEFRARKTSFITKNAVLSQAEADKFFPIYFELQNKKESISQKVHDYFKKGKNPKTTDDQYDELIKAILNARVESDELELGYYDKFKKILSPAKLFKVQQAERRFHRELLKNASERNRHSKK